MNGIASKAQGPQPTGSSPRALLASRRASRRKPLHARQRSPLLRMHRGESRPLAERDPPATTMRRIEFDGIRRPLAMSIKQPAFDEHLRRPRPRMTNRRELVARTQRQLVIQQMRELEIEAVFQIRTDIVREARRLQAVRPCRTPVLRHERHVGDSVPAKSAELELVAVENRI